MIRSGEGTYDINDRKRAEEALRESEELFRTLFETSSAATAIVERDMTISLVNEEFCRLLGCSKQDAIGSSWIAYIFEDDLPRMIENNRNRLAGAQGAPNQYEFRYRRVDGTIQDALINVALLRTTGKILCTFVDITERKRSEEALRESEYFFRESQRAASIGSYKTDFTADFWESSEVLDQIFGIGKDYSRSVQGWLDLVHPDDRKLLSRYLRDEVMAKQRPFAREYRIVRRNDGEVRWVSGFGNVAFDGDGHILSMIGTIQDVTERKRAEAERAKLEVQLQQAQKMESVGRLAGGVAHDFNNMLGVIIGHADLALEELGADHPASDDLVEIRKAASRSADLTRQLLAFARKQTITPAVLDLNETVEPMLTMLRRLIGEDVELTWRPGKGAWRVKMDPSQIDQMLANLCVNSRDAITGVGRVTIETENATLDYAFCAHRPGAVAGEYLRLSVSDDGCGMDKVTQAHLFEPFFTTKAVGKGTGLGLAMVYGIVKQNHGVIDVYSEPGVGTTFTIYLPRHLVAPEAVRVAGATDRTNRGHETILVVEDDPAVLKLTVRMLAGQGYTVLAARSPAEAIRVAGESGPHIHLVMTDVVMPGMNGRELAAKLLSLHPHLKRLFTSGYTADVIAHHGVLEEGVHFLQKPFALGDLAAKVREVLDGE
jgi:PAS domain S-box-containing protein